ncbi:5'-methylthioadenosine phosphorylase [Erythrobacter sp. SG61-1L]|uniref:S-methyl-5'-thioadenosine phosphorylase n=1 Tax=Erythrobacter sp. SG61-1L TaxID=1603897 RepID=UPI0006C90C94|nr:S-methyl-5'-thioadenosine phosphorylase [Erythrobacter sp. SG61-1L]KPL69641.1 5'-methylthioadenosine phosphorylase [Erythrobacter sp. SG61-1L]
MTASWHIGVIGGTGLYDAEVVEEAQQITVRSSFGEPSGPVTTGRIGDVRFTFLARHGAGHRMSPGTVNYRANIDVLKRCGVTDILSISAIGSLREEFAPGGFVVVDQMIDRTLGRDRSFFGEGLVAHVSLADPTCPRLSGFVGDAAEKAGAIVHRGGCYAAIEGPQFSTRAESHMYRAWGADVIGMTALPEARLAREAELPYALLAMVTDYDCWRESGEAVDVEEVLRVMHDNAGKARAALTALAGLLPKERSSSPIDTALEGAIVTSPEKRDQALVARLDAVAGRVLGRAVPAQKR